tara:strand:+ start:226 stop:648 length:423 start_codon:yes stop_codon:yes gene_type:complete
MIISLKKSDTIGAIASSLCVIHCLMTPLLFAVQSYTAVQYEAVPLWWKNLDFLFVTVSVFAVYLSTKNSSNTLVKYALWISWLCLFVLILNEKIGWVSLAEFITYFAALTLAILHLYNLNYCQCKSENCCNKNAQHLNVS